MTKSEEEEIDSNQNGLDICELFFNSDYEKQEIILPSGRKMSFLGLTANMTDSDLTGQILWPGCTLLMHWLDKNMQLFHGKTGVEVGAGTAICSTFIAKYGEPKQIIATDGSPPVCELMQKNIDLHPGLKNISCCVLDWGTEPTERFLEEKCHGEQFDFVYGSEIAYNENCVEGLVTTARILLKPNGLFVIGHIDRYAQTTRAFFRELKNQNFELESEVPWDDLINYRMELIVGSVYVFKRK